PSSLRVVSLFVPPPPPPSSTLFPYTTLFRSKRRRLRGWCHCLAAYNQHLTSRSFGIGTTGGGVRQTSIALGQRAMNRHPAGGLEDRKSRRLNSSHVKISYAVFCLKKKKNRQQ